MTGGVISGSLPPPQADRLNIKVTANRLALNRVNIDKLLIIARPGHTPVACMLPFAESRLLRES
jgi:hypothetical protein